MTGDEDKRQCVVCEEPKLDRSDPEDIRVCRECELARHRDGLEELTPEGFVAGSGWRLASTMLDIPHQYTVRDLTSPDAHRTTAIGHAEFEWFAALTLERGERRRWGSRYHHYLTIGEWKYWTMGFPPEMTTIINREALGPDATRQIKRQVAEARRRQPG